MIKYVTKYIDEKGQEQEHLTSNLATAMGIVAINVINGTPFSHEQMEYQVEMEVKIEQ